MSSTRTKIVYAGLVRSIVGKGEEELDLGAGSTVRDLIDHLIETYGEDFRSGLIGSDGKIRQLAGIQVNNQNISDLDGLDTKIAGEREVTILLMVYPISGGR